MAKYQIGMSDEVARLITSEEADRVTPLMSRIYYRLVGLPPEWWVEPAVVRVAGGTRGEVPTTAWAELVERLGVPPELAKEALEWMDKKEFIHYREVKGGREIEIAFEGLFFTDSRGRPAG
jgi:hypothetical protein